MLPLKALLPDPGCLACDQLQITPELITVGLRTTSPVAQCPACGRPSGRIHSRYRRRLADLRWNGQPVHLVLRVRRFCCDATSCPRQIFAERLPKVAAAYARKTQGLDAAVGAIAFACGGEGGSRLAARLAMPVSPDTLLRRIRKALPDAPTGLRVVGIDDWAVRRGQTYGTIVCDLEQHRPVDLLDDREAQTVAAWLHQHPGIQVITRDRARCYAEGASAGAPQATQVADRFHLMQNLRSALFRMLVRRYRSVVAAAREAATGTSASGPQECVVPPRPARTRRLPRAQTTSEVRRAHRLERYQHVVRLHQEGVAQREIARRLGMDREIVGRFVHAGQFPERAPRAQASRTDPHTGYLRKRWAEGCHNATRLWREMQARGFTGSYWSVRRRVAHWRPSHVEVPSAGTGVEAVHVPPPSAKRLAWFLLKEPADLEERDRRLLESLFESCSELAAAAELAREFATMVRHRRGDALDAWIQRAWNRSMPRELRAFASNLKTDYEAVKAALLTPWSNGQVEGQVNRLKLIKRQMYGRAKFDLLRRRVLHTG